MAAILDSASDRNCKSNLKTTINRSLLQSFGSQTLEWTIHVSLKTNIQYTCDNGFHCFGIGIEWKMLTDKHEYRRYGVQVMPKCCQRAEQIEKKTI